MSGKFTRGFTIIEVVLFLAVSGGLVIMLMAGVATSINHQKYKDSVNSIKAFIQTQYTSSANTINDRGRDIACKNGAIVKNNTERPGTSDCFLVGRYIRVGDNGDELVASNIIAYAAPNPANYATEQLTLQNNYGYILQPSNDDTATVFETDRLYIPWGAGIVKPQSNMSSVRWFSMLIIRSPKSGATYTFVQPFDNAQDMKSATAKSIMVGDKNQNEAIPLCVRPDILANGLIQPTILAVLISKNATNQASIEIPLENDSVVNGSAVKGSRSLCK